MTASSGVPGSAKLKDACAGLGPQGLLPPLAPAASARPCHRVLDVGCGAGAFAAELASQAERVDALDRSPVMIEQAERAVPANVSCILADVPHEPLPAGRYDAIVSISALYHMPLEQAPPRLAAALRPGGVLAAVALPRRDLLREWPAELIAAAGHRLFGLAFAILRAPDRSRWYAKEPNQLAMPVVLDPPLTARQVLRQASGLRPGAQVKRLVFRRYFLLWQKPDKAWTTPGAQRERETRSQAPQLPPAKPAAGLER